MVESHFGQIIEIKPSCIYCIIRTASLLSVLSTYTYRICYIYNSESWIKNMCISFDLIKMLRVYINASFFMKFSCCSIIKIQIWRNNGAIFFFSLLAIEESALANTNILYTGNCHDESAEPCYRGVLRYLQ